MSRPPRGPGRDAGRASAPGIRRRDLVGALGLGGLLLPLAGCGGMPDVFGPKITIDPSRPYVPVDPAKAAATINAYRAKAGSGPLTVDPQLNRIAAAYAANMASVDKMSHALSPWGPLDKRLRDGGYAYATAGENLGVGYRDLEDAFQGWRNSPAHDRGLKDPDMTHMGIASVYRPSTGWKTFWCLIFARPKGSGATAGSGGPFGMGQ